MKGRRLRRAALAGLALAGSLIGHALTYALAIRDAAHRSAHLTEAGHGYWDIAVWVGWAAAIAAIAWVVVRHARGESSGVDERFGRNALSLTAIQVAGFLALELAERASAGAPLEGVFDHRLLVVGILAQVAVALLGTWFLRWLARAGSLIGALLGGSPRPRASVDARAGRRRATIPPVAELVGGRCVRGPPCLVSV